MMLSKEKLSNRGRGKRALAYILLIAVCVIIIYPLLWTIGASFNPGNSLVSTSIIPKNPTNEHYVKLFAGEGNKCIYNVTFFNICFFYSLCFF